MKEEDIKMLDALMMHVMKDVTAFDMLTRAMICVRAAAQNEGKVNLMDIDLIHRGYEDGIPADVFNDQFLPVFGEIEPWPDEKDDPTPEEKEAFEAWMANMTHYFTLNENGWKLAEQIDKLWEAMSGIVPTDEQVNAWVKEVYEARKEMVLAENGEGER